MSQLRSGENRPVPADRLVVTVTSSAPVDVSALLLASDGRVRSDADFVFFNQPAGPGVTYRHGRGAGDMVDVDTNGVPADIDRIVVTASLDRRGPATFGGVDSLAVTIGPAVASGETLSFPIPGLSTEAAVLCVEIYRRGGAWKVRAVGQGYDSGLAGIATAFGVDIEDESQESSTPRDATTQVAMSTQQPPSAPIPQPSAPQPQHDPSMPPPHPQGSHPAPPMPPRGGQPPPGFPPGAAPPNPPGPPPPPGAPPPNPPGGQFPQGPPQSPAPPPPGAPQPIAPHQGAQPMHSDLFDPSHAEVNGLGIQKQGSKMIKVGVNGEVMARAGSMVAYQGDMQFQALGAGGIGRAIQERVTGEGVPLMKISGRGDLFLANAAADVHIIDLDGSDGLTINGANVLAFDPTLRYDVGRVQGAAGFASNAGLFNCVFSGRGRIAITSEGKPVVLNVDQPTYADPQAAIAWSSSLQTGIKRNDSLGFGRLIGRSTGEGMTLSFAGQGFVVVQPSELPPGGLLGGSGGGQQSGQSGGMLGGLLG